MPPKDIKDVHKAQADFTKQKRKVGKKAPEARTATATKITAKSIDVPLQDLDEKVEPTNSKNMTLKDLLQQAVHYNGSVRAECYRGMSDLFHRFPETFTQNISHLIIRFGEGMIDMEPMVRRAVCSLLFQFLHQIPSAKIAPFLKLAVQYLAAASSHIDAGIRADSVHFLRLFLTLYPAMFSKHLDPLLPNFPQLLKDRHLVLHAAASNSTANANTSLPSISVALNKMQRSSASSKKENARSLGASGLFASGGNSMHAGQQGSYHGDAVDGVGALLLHGINRTNSAGGSEDRSMLASQLINCPVPALFGMETSSATAHAVTTDPNAVHMALLHTPIAGMSPLQTFLSLLDAMLRLHAPPVEAEHMYSILAPFHPAKAFDAGSNPTAQPGASPSAPAPPAMASVDTSVLGAIGDDLFSSLAALGPQVASQQAGHEQRSDTIATLEVIQELSKTLIPLLLDCWVEVLPPDWHDNEHDAYEMADLASTLKSNGKIGSAKARGDGAEKKKSRTAKTTEGTEAKVLSHSLSVMSLICSVLLSLARVETALHRAKAAPGAAQPPVLEAYLPRLHKLVFPLFPFAATATHDMRTVSEINLSIAHIIALLISSITSSPLSLRNELLVAQQAEADRLAAVVAAENKARVLTPEQQMLQAQEEQARAEELAEMRHMGYMKSHDKKNMNKKNKNKKVTDVVVSPSAAKLQELQLLAAQASHAPASDYDESGLTQAHVAVYRRFCTMYAHICALQHALISYIYESFTHHSEQEVKAQYKLQARIRKRADGDSSLRAQHAVDARKRRREDESDASASKQPRTASESVMHDDEEDAEGDDEFVVGPHTVDASADVVGYIGIAPLADLLHIVWALLPRSEPELQVDLLQTFSQYYCICSAAPLSPNKLMCVPFVCALIHLDGGAHMWSQYNFFRMWLHSLPQVLRAMLSTVDIRGIDESRPHNAFMSRFSAYTIASLQRIPLAAATTSLTRAINYAARIHTNAAAMLLSASAENSSSQRMTEAYIDTNIRIRNHAIAKHLTQLASEDPYEVATTPIEPVTVDTAKFDWDQLQPQWVELLCSQSPVVINAEAQAHLAANNVPVADVVNAFKPGAFFGPQTSEAAQIAMVQTLGYSAFLPSSLLAALAFACRYSHQPKDGSPSSLFALPSALPLSVRTAIIELVAGSWRRARLPQIIRFMITAAMATTDVTVSPLVNHSVPSQAPQPAAAKDISADLIECNTQLSHPVVLSAVTRALSNLATVHDHSQDASQESVLQLLLPSLSDLLLKHTNALYATASASLHGSATADLNSQHFINIARIAVMFYSTTAYSSIDDSDAQTAKFLKYLSRALSQWLPLVLNQDAVKIDSTTTSTILDKSQFEAQPEAPAVAVMLMHSTPQVFLRVMGAWMAAVNESLCRSYRLCHAFVTQSEYQASDDTIKGANETVAVPVRSVVTSLMALTQLDVFSTAFRYHNAADADSVLSLAASQTCPLPQGAASAASMSDGFPDAPVELPSGNPSVMLRHLCLVLHNFTNDLAIVRGKLSDEAFTAATSPELLAKVRWTVESFPDAEQVTALRFAANTLLGYDPLEDSE